MAAQSDTDRPGWFTTLGNSVSRATPGRNGASEIAYLAPGSLGAGSGAVVVFGNSSALVDSLRTSEDTTAVLNAMAIKP